MLNIEFMGVGSNNPELKYNLRQRGGQAKLYLRQLKLLK